MKSDALLSSHFESLYPADTRAAQMQQIISYMKEGNSCQLVGLPGTGRANVLGFLTYNHAIREKHLGENSKWFHFVLVNFSEIRKRPLYDAMKFLFLAMLDSLRERKMDDVYQQTNEIFTESIKVHDELVLFHGLKRVIDLLAIEKELTVVFLFDRFEEYIPSVTETFFTNLRVLRNRAKYRFSVVFSVNRPLEETLEPSLFADFYEFLAGHIVYLPLYDKPGIDFRIQYLEKVTEKKIPEEIKKEVLSLTGGHMKLTRLAFENLQATSHQQRATSSSFTQFLLQQKTIQGALYEIWNYLTPAEQTHVLKRLYEPEHRDDHTKFLETIGLVQNKHVTIPLFQTFVDETFSPTETTATITLDPTTNEIKKGTMLLSDKLTALEYKLLRFLLKNNDRVVEREELIQAVWHDAKSTAGVTDQAVDQLIFRLRKKIEDDPNNPTHLQTVKGRGLKFLP